MPPVLPTRALGKDGKYSSRRYYISISSCHLCVALEQAVGAEDPSSYQQ